MHGEAPNTALEAAPLLSVLSLERKNPAQVAGLDPTSASWASPVYFHPGHLGGTGRLALPTDLSLLQPPPGYRETREQQAADMEVSPSYKSL